MKCSVCSSESDNTRHKPREMMFGFRDVFEYLECAKCKCLQIVEVPSAMSKYYPESYHSFAAFTPRTGFRAFPARVRDRYAVTGSGLLGRFLSRRFPPDAALKSLSPLDPRPSMRILDVGCGRGLQLARLRDLGFRSLLGIDPFLPHDSETQNGVELRRTTIHDITGEFDLVMFHHSFEHLSDPEASLQAANRLLARGGRCIIRMPTVSSYAWPRYGTNWAQLDAPRHFYVHSLESVRILATRAGLELSDVAYDSTAFQFWASEQYAADIPLYHPRSYALAPEASMFSRDQIKGFERRAAELNAAALGDQAAFYLTKTSVL